MQKTLHSIYIKHDTGFQSLSKRALSQILLKLIYLNEDRGISTQSLRHEVERATDVSFSQDDLMASLKHLNRESKVNSKRYKHYIHRKYKEKLEKDINYSIDLNQSICAKWFDQSATYESINGEKILLNWFQDSLIEFFKEYRYDWINDLRSEKKDLNSKRLRLQDILNATILNHRDILEEDVDWIKKRFIEFLESDDKEDNDLLWIYGSSMFASTLLTARNFADDFSLSMFKDSKFILDTNILMILELEGYEKNYAIKAMENIFKKHNIYPKYFYTSRDEYIRAIGPKKESIISTFENFGIGVMRDMDCAFVRTAISRGCETQEDFERFFQQIMQVPNRFGLEMILSCEDYTELNLEIEKGENDRQLKDELNQIYKRRSNRDKRERPITHDAGLISGAKYLRNDKKKCWVLTRDTTLREYGYKRALRDHPLTIGLDSFIQMLAIESGGTSQESTNFAPLFSKLIKYSITPERQTFQPEDFMFILKTKIEIGDLEEHQQIDLARNVNLLRFRGTPDEDIALEIRRFIQKKTNQADEDKISLKNENQALNNQVNEVRSQRNILKQSHIELRIKEEFRRYRYKIAKNWLIIIIIAALFFSLTVLVLFLNNIDNSLAILLGSFIVNILASIFFNFFSMKRELYLSKQRKNELKIKVENIVTDELNR